MTIHSDHPFATPQPDRDPVRRLRGRLAAPVTVWATGRGAGREGWTLSSVLIADGDTGDATGNRAPEVLGLLDEDTDLAAELAPGSLLVVNLLAAGQGPVADAFARVAPSPGGPFRTGTWLDTAWGPRLEGAAGWLGVRVVAEPAYAGWALLVRARIEHAEVDDRDPLVHLRGRYRTLDG